MQLPRNERAAFLDRECPDPALRARVEALLAADAAPHSLLDGNAEHSRTESFRPNSTTEAEGTLIAGRYKLRQQIGEGGMGTVWMADQTEPVKRDGGQRQDVLDIAAPLPDPQLLVLDDALTRLSEVKPDHAKLVELRFFAGLIGDEAAEALGVSPATADRMWRYARAWLQVDLAKD